jgi:Arc-like DNA binding domain
MAKKRKEAATPHLRIRIERELLARLEKSRKERGRTLTGEIVDRVEQSFRKEDDDTLAVNVFRAAFGGPTGDLLRAFATAIWLIERRTGKKWQEDIDTSFQASSAVAEIFKWFAFRPGAALAATHAARLKYELSNPADITTRGAKLGRDANIAALETLRHMGMAPSDAEIDAAAERADKSKDEGEDK